MGNPMPTYCEWCSDAGHLPSPWVLVMEFFLILITVKVVFWMLSRSAIVQRRSPRITPIELGHELLLRKRLVTLNWKLLANKARALYYTKRVHSRRGSLAGDSQKEFREIQ